uniref:Uncharacterized protein n=1 Tax=Plectus sambesii TaxID=2011161 RepID=A0A914WY30_9BILA
MQEMDVKAESCTQAVVRLFSSKIINVEPVILLGAIGTGIFGQISPMFVYYARCVNLFSHDQVDIADFCMTLSQNANRTDYEDMVQSDVASLRKFQTVAGSLPALFIAPILGAWADGSGGRRYPLMLALLSSCISSVVALFTTLIYANTSIWVMAILWELLGGLLGGGMVFLAASMAIVTDSARIQKSDGSTLSLRMGIAAAIQSIGFLIGSLATSRFVSQNNPSAHFHALLVACIFNIISLAYTALFVGETGRRANLNPAVKERNAKGIIRIVLHRYGEVLRTLTVKRIGWTRLCLNLIVAFVFIEFLALDNNLLYLYIKKKLQWTDETFTYYSMCINVLSMIGMISWPLVIEHTTFMGKDAVLIIIGFIFNTAYWALLSVANSDTMMFSIVVLVLFSAAMSPGFRALVPKLVTVDETARVFTAFGIAINIAPIVAAWVFVSIYQASLTFWVGLSFAVCAVIQVFVLIGFCITYYLLIKSYQIAHAAGQEVEFGEFHAAN